MQTIDYNSKLKVDRNIGEFEMSNGSRFFGISEVVKWFSEMQGKGAEKLLWYGQSHQGEVSSLVCVAYVTELETDEQYNKRMEMQKIWDNEREVKRDNEERELYEKLKAKFEK